MARFPPTSRRSSSEAPSPRKKLFKKMSDPRSVRPPTYDGDPPGPRRTPKEHLMTTMRDLDPTAAAVRADEFDRTTFAPRGDDATSAWAWASSPLGEPSDHAGDLSDQAGDLPYGYDLPTELITPAATRKPIDKLIVGAGLIGLIGAGTALGIALLSGSPQSQRSTAVRASSDAPATVAAAAPSPVVSPTDNGPAPAPVVNLPDNSPAPAPVVALPDNAPAPAPVVAPAPVIPPPPPDPGTPPAAWPSGPVVGVYVPPPRPVWMPLPPPQLPPPPSLPPLPAPPGLCLPPHHLAQGGCK